jgi:hypothetical protein
MEADGRALQRVLLVGCRCGPQASYLNQPTQTVSLRPRLQTLLGGGFPLILQRLSYPVEEIPAAPRRAIEDVIGEGTVQHGSAVR